MEPDATRYDIALVGAGRVGQTLGRLLLALGHRIVFVACRTRASAERAVTFIGAGQPMTYDDAPLDVVQAGRGVVCITTPDAAIAPTAVHLAGVTRFKAVWGPGRLDASLTRLWYGYR